MVGMKLKSGIQSLCVICLFLTISLLYSKKEYKIYVQLGCVDVSMGKVGGSLVNCSALQLFLTCFKPLELFG